MILRHNEPVNRFPGQSPIPTDRELQRRKKKLIYVSVDRLYCQINDASDGHVMIRRPLRVKPQTLEFRLETIPFVVDLWQTSCITQLVTWIRGYARLLTEIAEEIESGAGDEWTDELRPQCYAAVSPSGQIIAADFWYYKIVQHAQDWANSHDQGPATVVQYELADFPDVEKRFNDWLENGRDVPPCFIANQTTDRGAS